ncbi:ETX/MTX2 family pore-forming toxin [Listeria sp. PSOL-1]|uniref:ETX/MTX2 family pore-forming toxin n=1 Tax=Listeria sp. PSOL-1 TaxID=1844999 RepID=UPI0013D2DA20|nr:ETX/MTX2 family pore-forming toxin [Listeria sp. PSOL-1]
MKKLKLFSLLLLPSVILSTTTPYLAAEKVHAEAPSEKAGIIVPITDRLNAIAKDYYEKQQYMSHVDNYTITNLIRTTQNQKFDVSGSQLGSPTKGNETPIYMGTNTFDNTDSATEQTYNTSEFSQAVAYSNSTSTTKGFKFNSDQFIQIFLPESKINLEFNASSTQTNTKTVTNTVVATRQPIKVPAGKKYRVTVDLRKVSYYGKVSLNAFTTDTTPTFTNKLQGYHYDSHGIPTQKQFDITDPYDFAYFTNSSIFNKNDIKFETNATDLNEAIWKYVFGTLESKISFVGEGDYSYETGTEFFVTTEDITDSNNVKVVDKQSYKLK